MDQLGKCWVGWLRTRSPACRPPPSSPPGPALHHTARAHHLVVSHADVGPDVVVGDNLLLALRLGKQTERPEWEGGNGGGFLREGARATRYPPLPPPSRSLVGPSEAVVGQQAEHSGSPGSPGPWFFLLPDGSRGGVPQALLWHIPLAEGLCSRPHSLPFLSGASRLPPHRSGASGPVFPVYICFDSRFY